MNNTDRRAESAGRQVEQFDRRAALAVVIANMIGTGVFTSLGYQLADIRSGFAILLLWGLGGLTALCGALCYAELGAALPRSGGEYNFLGRIYHPGAGFVSGWLSATVGFAAPVALVAMTFAAYLGSVLRGLPQQPVAVALIVTLALLHMRSHRVSGATQTWFTVIKVALIVLFCSVAFWRLPATADLSFLPQASDVPVIGSAAFAVALIYVNYAYTGWNAATYITGEMRDAQRALPWVLTVGALTVTMLYVGLNAAFLHAAPMAALVGRIEIGYVAGEYLFGTSGARIVAVALALLLISTVSAMTLAGPRVLQVIGQDFPIMALLARENRAGIPVPAIALQALIAVAFVLTATFESILVFTGFVLGLNTLIAVLGVFVLRLRQPGLPRPFKVPLYPLPPLLFSAIMLWTLVHILAARPIEGWLGLAIVAIGALAYVASVHWNNRNS